MKFYLIVGVVMFLAACQPGSSAQENLPIPTGKVVVFTNVNVVSMENESVLEAQNVVIENDKIFSIGQDTPYPNGAQVIEATGKFLVPGLAEMHAHIPTPPQGEELIEETMFLYLAAGVTTIRGMLGHPRHLRLRTEVADGTVLGPHIYTSGPSINGDSAPDGGTAAKMVREQKEAGYNFLKLHPGIKRAVFDTMVYTAKQVGIPYAGHVSTDVGIHHALESDYASVDHIDGYVEGLVPPEKSVNPEENGFFGINFTDLADESLLSGLIQKTLDHNVWVVPTQCLAERWAGPLSTKEILNDPEMAYMAPQTLERWGESKNQMMANTDIEKARRWIELRRRIIKAMFDSGVGILLGSDAPQVFNVPGFAVHHELAMYVAAGLSPYEALMTGTVNPAKYFGIEAKSGLIKPGYQADLLLVDGNPLNNISNLKVRSGVMIRGKWLSQDYIAQRLDTIASKYRN